MVNQNSSKSSSKERSPDANHHLLSLRKSLEELKQGEIENQATLNIVKQNIKEETKYEDEFEDDECAAPTVMSRLSLSPAAGNNRSKTSSRRLSSSINGGNCGGGLRFTYFAASSLSDDRWLCPICLDIYDDAVETPCCHNLFCEKCIS